MKAVIIAGPFSDADVRELLAAMRVIEQRNPQATYRAVVNDLHGEQSISEMVELLDRIFPKLADQIPIYTAYQREKA